VSYVRLIVVDDHLAFAEALAERLRMEPDFVVPAVVTSGDAARREVATRELDVALVDLGLPDVDGVTLVRELRVMRPGLRVVMVSAGGQAEQVAEAIRSGATAWVPKDSSIDYLIEAVRGVLRDETRFPGRLLTEALTVLLRTEHERGAAKETLARLTARELEVLTCMADGLGRAEIAERLFLSPNTVRTHMQSILGKLGVHSSLAAVALGRRLEIC
jgi:DNA-binding NarL/FixJ family response regulator